MANSSRPQNPYQELGRLLRLAREQMGCLHADLYEYLQRQPPNPWMHRTTSGWTRLEMVDLMDFLYHCTPRHPHILSPVSNTFLWRLEEVGQPPNRRKLYTYCYVLGYQIKLILEPLYKLPQLPNVPFSPSPYRTSQTPTEQPQHSQPDDTDHDHPETEDSDDEILIPEECKMIVDELITYARQRGWTQYIESADISSSQAGRWSTLVALFRTPPWVLGDQLNLTHASQETDHHHFDLETYGFSGTLESKVELRDDLEHHGKGMLVVSWRADFYSPYGWWIALFSTGSHTPLYTGKLGDENEGQGVILTREQLQFEPYQTPFVYLIYPGNSLEVTP